MAKQNPLKENPDLLNELRDQLQAMSGAVRRLMAGPLNERAILLLIKDSVGQSVGMNEIKEVVKAITELESKYLKKKIKQ